MKVLNSVELTDYIKDRQAKQVRALRQADSIFPKLVVIQDILESKPSPFIQMIRTYSEEILVDVEVQHKPESEIFKAVKSLNSDKLVHGTYINRSKENQTYAQAAIDSIVSQKEISGTGKDPLFDSITSVAIDWLLAGYNIDTRGKHIVIVGNETTEMILLSERWQESGQVVQIVSPNQENLKDETLLADILVCATGLLGLIMPEMVKPNAVIIDAGLLSEDGSFVGNVAPGVRELPNITITSVDDGINTIKVCALLDNVIRAARSTVESNL